MNTKPRDNPLISVIIATYNRERFIGEAIDSVLHQTYQNFEIIIVDDGSTDGTRFLIESKYLSDHRCTYIYQANQKRAAAFNNGLAHSNGRYIAILDSDNRWVPQRLERGLRALQDNPDFDIAHADNVWINEDGLRIPTRRMKRHSGVITRHLVRDNCVGINTALVPRYCFDELGPMDETCKRSDDYELWLRFSTRYRFLYLPEALAEYRVMADQLSSDKSRRFDANWTILNDFRQRFPDALTSKEFAEGFAHFHIRKARYLAAQGQRGAAFAEVLKAARRRPFSIATLKTAAAVALKRRWD